MGLIQPSILNKHMYVSGVWLYVELRTDTNQNMCLNVSGLRAFNMLTVIDSMVNIIGGINMNNHLTKNFIRQHVNIFLRVPKTTRKTIATRVRIANRLALTYSMPTLADVGH